MYRYNTVEPNQTEKKHVGKSTKNARVAHKYTHPCAPAIKAK